MLLSAILLTVQFTKAQSSAMKDPVTFKLKNGMTVIVAENSEATKVFAGFTSDSRLSASVNKPGVQELLLAMMNSNLLRLDSTLTYTEKGGNINTDAGHFDKALELLSSALKHPLFSQKDLDNARNELIGSLEANNRYFPDGISKTSLGALNMQDVNVLYDAIMVPSKSFLTIVGNIRVSEAKLLAKKSLGNWKGSSSLEIAK